MACVHVFVEQVKGQHVVHVVTHVCVKDDGQWSRIGGERVCLCTEREAQRQQQDGEAIAFHRFLDL